MRMTRLTAVLLAVVCAAVAGAEVYGNASRARRAVPLHHPHRMLNEDEMDSVASWKRSHWRQSQSILREESHQGFSECCPSVVEMVAPKGGSTPGGLFVELYEDKDHRQQLYELSCAKDVVGKPCRFIDARLYNQSICVQKYSYSYALVRNPSDTEYPHNRHKKDGPFSWEGWSMDYIRVRSGCECQIIPHKRKNQHRRRLERHKKKKNRRYEEDDET